MNLRRCLSVVSFSVLLVMGAMTFVSDLRLLAQEGRIKIILDLDIGDDIDDAWALAFVVSHKNFETLGITTTHGNTSARAKVACKMLSMTGQRNIPVFVGRQTEQKKYSYQYTWAEDFEALKPQKKNAADFIVETVKRYPGQVTLLAVGPLENVADALRKEPQLGKYLKRVVLMSGCIYGSTRSPGVVAEYNVRSAISEAQAVYQAGLPLTIVPLDSTTLVRLSEEEREQVRKFESPLTFALEALYRLWILSPQSKMTLHDQLAVAETASSRRFFGKFETLPLIVDEKGFTRIDEKLGKPAIVCLEPKRDDFMRYYISELLQQRLGMEP